MFNGPQKFNDQTLGNLYSLYLPNYNNIYDDDKKDMIEKDKVKPSLDKMFNIIDCGIDKTVIDFSKEINLLSKKIISTAMSNTRTNSNKKDNIYQSNFFLPINSMHKFKKKSRNMSKMPCEIISQAEEIINIC